MNFFFFFYNRANAKPGETLLIHGASGSVGIATIQFAKTHGLKIIGTAGTKEGMELVKEQGADYVYNHKEENYMETVKHDHPDGIDIILEMLANVNLNNDLQILKAKKGRVVVNKTLFFSLKKLSLILRLSVIVELLI